MSWAPEVEVADRWERNEVRFETKVEAEIYALDLYSRWTLCTNHRAVLASEPVNYAIIDRKVVRLTELRTTREEA